MKRIKKIIFITAIIFLFCNTLFLMGVEALSIVGIQSLDFGDVYVGSPPKIIYPHSPEAGSVMLMHFGGLFNRVNFEIYFEPEEVELTHGQGGKSLKVSNFTTELEDDRGSMGFYRQVYFGATLAEVPYGIHGGNYTGSATINVILID